MDRPDLKQIAIDIVEGKIFTHLQCNGNDIMMTFMIMVFISDEQRKNIIDTNPALIYEYLDQAGPMGCNGMPIFMSMRYMPMEDWLICREHIQEYVEMKEKFLSVKPEDSPLRKRMNALSEAVIASRKANAEARETDVKSMGDVLGEKIQEEVDA